MKNKINLYLVQFAINSILRKKSKNIFTLIIFTMLTFILTAVFFIVHSIQYELNTTVEALPQIIVQNTKAGRSYDCKTNMVNNILELSGVSDANARVWGYYYFENAKVNFTIVGIDQYEEQYKDSLASIVNKFDMDIISKNSSMVVGVGVKKIMEQNYYKEYFNFITPNGDFKKIKIGGVFKSSTQLESNDMIVVSKDNARQIFGMREDMATDIVVSVQNPKEIPTVIQKIKLLYPNTRVISNENLKVSYQNIFNYKGGIFLAIFIIVLFTFFMMIYDKSSGLSTEEKKEIGILKAIGWRVDDVLKEKFYESFIISFIAYMLGIAFAFAFVYILQAPILRDIFIGYDGVKTTFALPFVFDLQTLFLVFFLSVPIYIAATIIPSWRVATLETDEVIR